ncbi:MAG: hypothetical protein AAFQ74_22075, partial [Cyanobacteria bacterium J06623_4]
MVYSNTLSASSDLTLSEKGMPNLNSQTHQLSGLLQDFQQALENKIDQPQVVYSVLQKIQDWTNGQPFLTKLICQYVLPCAASIDSLEEVDVVDTLVEQKILKNWKNQGAANHLKQLEKTLLSYDNQDSLLILYLQILQRKTLPPANSPAQQFLQHVGLIALNHNQLSVSNAVYARVFDEAWIERQRPGITRPVTIIDQAPSSARTATQTLRSSLRLPIRSVLLACGLLASTVFIFSQCSRSDRFPGDAPA